MKHKIYIINFILAFFYIYFLCIQLFVLNLNSNMIHRFSKVKNKIKNLFMFFYLFEYRTIFDWEKFD